MFTALYAFRAVSQGVFFDQLNPWGSEVRTWSSHTNWLGWGAYWSKKGIPLRRLPVVKLELFCQYLKPDCWLARQPQRVISSQPCPRLSGEVYFEQGCHHSQSKPNKGSIYCLKYIGLYFFFICSIGHWLQGLAHSRQALFHWAAPTPYLFLLISGYAQCRLFWILPGFCFVFPFGKCLRHCSM